MLKSPHNSCIYDNLNNLNNANNTNNVKCVQYKDVTFSGYKKTQVFQELKKSILKGEIDKACFWAAELDASCFTSELWTKLLLFAAKEINYANPSLPFYLYKRYQEYCTLSINWDRNELRNSQESRNRLCELICILSLSAKKKFPDYPKIKDTDFKIYHMKRKMIAKNQTLIANIVSSNNTTEIKIALNEFANYLTLDSCSTDSIKNCLFWLDWIAYYTKLYKKIYGQELKCNEARSNPQSHVNIDPKYINNFIWYIWDIILYTLTIIEKRVTSSSSFDYLKENIDSLHLLYKTDFAKGNMNSRLVYVKYAVLLIKKNISSKIYRNTTNHLDALCIHACANVNDLYRFILNNRQIYQYNLKEQQLNSQIESIPSQLQSEADIENNIRRNHQRMIKSKEIGNYIQNQKYGREKFEAEIRRLSEHNKSSLNKYMNNMDAIHDISKTNKISRIDKLKQSKQLKKTQERIQKMQICKQQERVKHMKIKQNARNLYRNMSYK